VTCEVTVCTEPARVVVIGQWRHRIKSRDVAYCWEHFDLIYDRIHPANRKDRE